MVWYRLRRGLMDASAAEMARARVVEMGTVMMTSTKVFSTAWRK